METADTICSKYKWMCEDCPNGKKFRGVTLYNEPYYYYSCKKDNPEDVLVSEEEVYE